MKKSDLDYVLQRRQEEPQKIAKTAKIWLVFKDESYE